MRPVLQHILAAIWAVPFIAGYKPFPGARGSRAGVGLYAGYRGPPPHQVPRIRAGRGGPPAEPREGAGSGSARRFRRGIAPARRARAEWWKSGLRAAAGSNRMVVRAETAAHPGDGANPMSTATMTRPTVSIPRPHRITVDEYERIIEAGALEDPGRVELIDGYMVDKMSKNAAHQLDHQGSPQGAGQPTAGRMDIAEGRAGADPRLRRAGAGRRDHPGYRRRLRHPDSPTAADVALLVEVSDSTLVQDRGKKLPAYAKGKIPVYWIVNLVDRQVEVYSRPGKKGYRSHRPTHPASKSRSRSAARSSPRSPLIASCPAAKRLMARAGPRVTERDHAQADPQAIPGRGGPGGGRGGRYPAGATVSLRRWPRSGA